MAKKNIEAVVESENINPENIEIENTVVSTETSHVQEENRKPQRYPYVQNRKCGVFMVKQLLSDGETIRVLQILDSPVDFATHLDFVNGMNNFRKERFGKAGDLYVTKNVDIPTENPDFVVHFAFIHTKTGKITGEKAFTKAEGQKYLTKIREDIRRWKENRWKSISNYKSPTEFGSSLGEAIRDAKNSTRESAVAK